MNESEIFTKNDIAARCDSCGEVLYDGCTAYLLIGRVFCHACVTSSLMICRTPEDEAHLTPHLEAHPAMLGGIRHTEIRPKTAQIRTKTAANSKTQKG